MRHPDIPWASPSPRPLQCGQDELPHIEAAYFQRSYGHYALEGRLLRGIGDGGQTPRLLAIHGARSDYTKLNPILGALARLGCASLSFNQSGHNAGSGVMLEATSLARNLDESIQFAAYLHGHLEIVLGHSLGGALALKVAEQHGHTMRSIILFCPAIYPEAAYGPPFGPAFTQAISTPFGFADSSSLAFLRRFQGRLVLVMGEYDGLASTDFGGEPGRSAGHVVIADHVPPRPAYSAIPHEVVTAIEDALPSERLLKIVLPDCDHAVAAWLRARPDTTSSIAARVLDFVS